MMHLYFKVFLKKNSKRGVNIFNYLFKFEKNIDTITLVGIGEWCMQDLVGFEF